jgi:hypothetical protein
MTRDVKKIILTGRQNDINGATREKQGAPASQRTTLISSLLSGSLMLGAGFRRRFEPNVAIR